MRKDATKPSTSTHSRLCRSHAATGSCQSMKQQAQATDNQQIRIRLDRCHTYNFITRFCRATLSHYKIASVKWRIVQLLNSHATPF